MKKLLVNLCMAAMIPAAPFCSLAKPAKPGLLTRTQPDGTTIEYRIIGDERGHVLLSDDGYLLTDIDNALYYARVEDNGHLVSSNILAKPVALRQEADLEFLKSVDTPRALNKLERVRESVVRREAGDKGNTGSIEPDSPEAGDSLDMHIGKFSGNAFPAFGQVRGLVVLVEYKDVEFTLEDPLDYYTRQLNEEGFADNGATGSARDYFIETSSGQFLPQFDVYGPIKLSRKRSYYGGNDWAGNDNNPEKMAIEACQQLDSIVDFSQYDMDLDGYIDNIYVIYAGGGEATGGGASTVWPHSWEVSAATSTPYIFDDVRLDHYACGNEWEDGVPDGVGTFIHEFSHVMGLPDLYATSYTNAFTPGSWSVLDYGPYNNDGRTPPLYSIFERNALGWMTPEMLPDSTICTLPQISENQGYMLCTSKQNEFFLFENRQLKSWDSYLPGHGMLVWHIDYNDGAWYNNTVNNNGAHQYVDILEADNKASEYSRGGDAFPGTANVTKLTDSTKPALVTWGKKSLGHPITNIEEVDSVISFYVSYKPPVLSDFQVLALEASEITDSTFIANWEALELASEYFVTVYELGDSTCVVEGYELASAGAETMLVIENLTPGTDYCYVVEACDGELWAQPSEVIAVTTTGTKPAGIADAMAGKSVAKVEYYTLTGIPCPSPSKGIFLRLTTYSDGSRRTQKITVK